MGALAPSELQDDTFKRAGSVVNCWVGGRKPLLVLVIVTRGKTEGSGAGAMGEKVRKGT